MAGLELAGVILAIFPIIVEGAELYMKGAHALARWRTFNRVLKRLLLRIDLEQVKFYNNCEALLRDITEPGQLQRLMKDPGGPEWSQSDLQHRLEKQLGRSYRVYMEATSEINRLLEEIRNKLELDQAGKPKWTDTQGYQKQWKRIKITLTETSNESLLDELRINNADLQGLLGHRRQMLALGDSTVRSAALSYQENRAQADSFYTALENSFASACNCCTPHRASIYLSRNKISWKPDCRTMADGIDKRSHFVVLFSLHTTRAPDQGPSSGVHEWHETMVNNTKIAGGNPLVGCNQIAHGMPMTPPRTPLGHSGLPNVAPASSSISAGSLCTALKTRAKSAHHLITLHGGQDWQHRIDLMHRFGVSSSTAIVNLRDALKHGLDRKVRLALAVKLASSTLQLQTTSWMSYSWNSSEIYLLKEGQAQSQMGHAFVSAAFPARGSKAPVRRDPFSRETRNAGIFALGIALIELCYGKTLEDLRPKPDGTPMSVADIIAAARSLSEQIYLEAGEEYGDAVRRCIYCEFDQRYTDLDRPEMIDAVHREVCEPLEATLYAFCGGKIGNLVD
ncbi:hypothetical protein CKM354_000219600 [Cercospora kikuchii]|uniref:DUF7580 domain-containing protein n=1 Tax=Cercospora kikuchii TaxID=84275 RepID=A0A9P3CE89_9PEZI|nr:uncharacterized protein CKM354_000219600 [Cercospora kikuchii]GIZ38795.1 hypothetical protein CKM354_000219600 [Cercospora kikuchii]